jgi:sulfonate transport system permease protein
MSAATALNTVYRHRHVRGWALPLAALCLWWMTTRYHWVDSTILLPIGDLVHAASEAPVQRTLLHGVAITFSRLLEGVAFGMSAGVLLGTAMGLSTVFDRVMGPSFHAVRQVAVLAWIPILTAWFGNGELCKVVFIAIAASKPMVMGAYQGARAAPEELVELGKVLRFTPLKMLRYVRFPAALPVIVAAVQLSMIYAWFAAIGSEYLIGSLSGGIGAVVISAEEQFRTDVVLLGVTLISVVGIVINTALHHLPKLLSRWQ